MLQCYSSVTVLHGGMHIAVKLQTMYCTVKHHMSSHVCFRLALHQIQTEAINNYNLVKAGGDSDIGKGGRVSAVKGGGVDIG